MLKKRKKKKKTIDDAYTQSVEWLDCLRLVRIYNEKYSYLLSYLCAFHRISIAACSQNSLVSDMYNLGLYRPFCIGLHYATPNFAEINVRMSVRMIYATG